MPRDDTPEQSLRAASWQRVRDGFERLASKPLISLVALVTEGDADPSVFLRELEAHANRARWQGTAIRPVNGRPDEYEPVPAPHRLLGFCEPGTWEAFRVAAMRAGVLAKAVPDSLLPASVRDRVSDLDRWAWALFEIGWRKLDTIPFRAEKWVRDDGGAIQLELARSAGLYRGWYYSEIGDAVSASIDVVDVLRSMERGGRGLAATLPTDAAPTYGSSARADPLVGDSMADFATRGDQVTHAKLQNWKVTAAEEIDDIGGWREATDNPSCYWGDPPKGFFGDTSWLVGWITSHHPKLDPCPLQDVYSAIVAWHEDHNAVRIPAQPVLFATLERAVLTLQAVEMAIRDRFKTTDDDVDAAKCSHSECFTSVIWFGTRYKFAKGNQAGAIEALWEAWETGGHSLSQETIGVRCHSEAKRFEMRKTFRHRVNGKYEPHLAWGAMIQEDSKGSYRLVAPESTTGSSPTK